MRHAPAMTEGGSRSSLCRRRMQSSTLRHPDRSQSPYLQQWAVGCAGVEVKYFKHGPADEATRRHRGHGICPPTKQRASLTVHRPLTAQRPAHPPSTPPTTAKPKLRPPFEHTPPVGHREEGLDRGARLLRLAQRDHRLGGGAGVQHCAELGQAHHDAVHHLVHLG